MYRAPTVALGVICLFVAGNVVGLDARQASAPPPPPAFALAGLRAYLFYEPLGQIDERELISSSLALWNTAIGGGEAKAPSNTVIVQADVTGPGFSTETKGSVSLVATLGKRVLRRESIPLSSFFAASSKLSIPFLVRGSGCGTLRLSAVLTTPGHQQRLTNSIEFPCGE